MSIFSKLLVLFIVGKMSSNLTAQQDIVLPHHTFSIDSKELNEKRVINVWTPPGQTKDSFAFPVMYMADGGVAEDFPHIAQTFSELIAAKKIPPFILVGIENTQRRRDLTGPTAVRSDKKIAPIVGGSENFRAFIQNELFPEIEKRYTVNDKRGILGESLSGLFVMETFFLEPNMFDYNIAFDPSLWWNNHALVKNAEKYLKTPPITTKRIWFAGSDAKDIYQYTQELEGVFSANAHPNLHVHYSDEPKEQHTTIFRATKEKAIVWTLRI